MSVNIWTVSRVTGVPTRMVAESTNGYMAHFANGWMYGGWHGTEQEAWDEQKRINRKTKADAEMDYHLTRSFVCE